MDESPDLPCAFPLCSRSARTALRLLVEEEESMLASCDRHAGWLRGYVHKDDAVQVIDETPLVPADRFAD